MSSSSTGDEPEVRPVGGGVTTRTHTVELPVAGGAVELTTGGLRPTYRFTEERVGVPGRTALVDDLLVGARAGGSGRGRWTLAWGALSAGRVVDDVRVEFRAGRHALRPPRTVSVAPQTLGDRMWVAEVAGRFDEVRVEAGELVETRDLRA